MATKNNTHQINYKASKTCSLLHQDDTFFRGIMGPFGSGKSVAMCMEILRRAIEMVPCKDGVRRSKWVVVRNTYRELKDSTIATWLKWVPEKVFGVFHKNDLTHYVRFDDVELDVIFRALDHPDDVRKLLSTEYTGAWLNEAREIPKAIIDALPGRVTRFPAKQDLSDPAKAFFGVIMDTNPPDMQHWWYRLAETPEFYVDEESLIPVDVQLDEIAKTYKFFRQPSGLADGSAKYNFETAENIENLNDPKYYTRLMIGKSREWIQVYVHGEYGFIVDGKPVFSEYRDQVHCNPQIGPVPGVPIIRGWDFGLTPTCVFLQITPIGQVIVFDELNSEDMGIDRFSDQVIAWAAARYPSWDFADYGDPAGTQRAQTDERTCYQILETKGIDIEPGAEDLTMRLESVRRVLNGMTDGKPQFQLHPRCDVLRRGFLGGYQRRRMATSSSTGSEKYTDKPDKNNIFTHAHDALQYPLTRIVGAAMLSGESLLHNHDEYDEPPERSRRSFHSGRSRITGY